MTTPALNSPYRCIKLAMQDAGLLQEGDVPTSNQIAEYSGRLIDVIQLYQTQGLKLFLLVDTAVPLVAGQSVYTFGTSGDVVLDHPTRVIQAYYLYNTSGVRRPITVLSWNEYLLLSTTTQQGVVSQYMVDKRIGDLRVFFWLTPDSTEASGGQAHLLLQTRVTTFTNMTDSMSFPQEWFIALRWGLADDICTGQPEAIMTRCKQNAMQYRMMLEDWDVEDAPTMFQMDPRLNQGPANRFV